MYILYISPCMLCIWNVYHIRSIKNLTRRNRVQDSMLKRTFNLSRMTEAKPNVPRFGPLERGCHVLAKDSLANIVRETAVQADIACRFLTEMNGGTYISHTMERLKQIRRMEERL